ncbi:MAG: endolytic transglycosylase MltG [Syntrophomonadaceae bacterium]|nr:endolytic transglycosylase MltG [Syntrophomonadaceae bacterium]
MRGLNIKYNRMGILVIIAIVFVVLMGIGSNLIDKQYEAVDKTDKTLIDVNIPEQSTARQIAKILLDHDLIHSEKAFLNYCKRTKNDAILKAGHYQFSRSQSVQEIVTDIAAGKIVTIAFTIPEGYTVKQIGELLVAKELFSEAEWQEAVSTEYSYDFLKYGYNDIKEPLEGFLFPDTYRIPDNITASALIELMLKNFQSVWEKDFAKMALDKDYNIFELVTIAAMIEKEAAVAKDRPTISGVIYNRLRINMPLQIDATVLYALGTHKDVVLNRDLTVNSPYNTYKYGGLPAGPIASPGKDSIKAALNPEKHNYLYYLAKGDGSHYFARTFDEHLRAKAKYID